MSVRDDCAILEAVTLHAANAGIANETSGRESMAAAYHHVVPMPPMQEAAAELDGGKMRLLAAASHDLRQPLQAIGLWVELLREQISDPGIRCVLARMQESARGAESLLNALLDISRFDLGVVEPRSIDFLADDLLQRMASTFAPIAAQRRLELRVVGSRAIVHSDPALLERILANFLENALRYTVRGGVVLGCRRHGRELAFAVCDSGPGIPAARLQDIFDEFVQIGVESGQRRQGLGLGLSIANRVSRVLGHRIRVSSAVGLGSCFRVDVPLSNSTATTDETPCADAMAKTLTGAFVVVVEDEPEQREALGSLLRRWGCHVVIACSAHGAIEQLTGHLRAPNAIISDYQLGPGATGPDAIRVICRALGEDIPSIILTGEHSAFRDSMICTSGWPVMTKPVAPEHLRRQLANLLVRPG